MSYEVAGIDIHKKVLMVVVATAAEEVADSASETLELECRRFGAGASERKHLCSWLRERNVREVVMESTAQYWKPVWLDREPHFGNCIWRRRTPIVRPRGARTIFAMGNGWRGGG